MREEEIEVILICLDNTSREMANPPLSKFSLFLNHTFTRLKKAYSVIHMQCKQAHANK